MGVFQNGPRKIAIRYSTHYGKIKALQFLIIGVLSCL